MPRRQSPTARSNLDQARPVRPVPSPRDKRRSHNPAGAHQSLQCICNLFARFKCRPLVSCTTATPFPTVWEWGPWARQAAWFAKSSRPPESFRCFSCIETRQPFAPMKLASVQLRRTTCRSSLYVRCRYCAPFFRSHCRPINQMKRTLTYYLNSERLSV